MKKNILIFFIMLATLNTAYSQDNIAVFKKTLAVKSALHSAFWGVDLNMKQHKHPSCPAHEVGNIEVFNYTKGQAEDINSNDIWYSKWYEIWTVYACGDEFKIKIDFFQTQNDESTCKMKILTKNGKEFK